MSNIRWVSRGAFAAYPPSNAVIGGTDSDGSIILVGRANHCGDNLAAKVNLARNEAYVAHGGQEILKESFELLTGCGFQWLQSGQGIIPQHAVPTGTTANGKETLYIGRVYYNGSLVVGKVQPSHSCCYIPYEGCELSARTYEMLVQKPKTRWVSIQGNYDTPVDDPVEAGLDSDGTRILVGRVHYNGNVIPAKVMPEKSAAYIPFGGHEVFISEDSEHKCEILCGSNFSWVPSGSGLAHANAFVGGRTEDGELLFIGRKYQEYSTTPGKIRPSHGCLSIPYGGAELKFDTYEILVKD